MTAAIYVIDRDRARLTHVPLAVARLRAVAETLIVVTLPGTEDEVRAALSDTPPDRIVTAPAIPPSLSLSALAGYKAGLAALREAGATEAPAILTGAHVFGPIGALEDRLAEMRDCDLLAPYWHLPGLDTRLAGQARGAGLPERIPYLDFAILSARLLADAAFFGHWARFRPSPNAWTDFLQGPGRLAAWMRDTGYAIRYAVPEDACGTADPRLYEADTLIAQGAPCLAVAALTMDPLLHDLNGTDLRAALDAIRARDPALQAGIVNFASQEMKLRDFTTVADQYEIFPETAADPDRQDWSFGPVAVFIHAFYAEMMPQFWTLIARLPCRHHLFLTTASAENKAGIETFLRGKGLGDDAFTVRVVEQNRGRDMSSLFITWRDVVLSGDYEVALRLHSKRTPQVSPQVAEGFKTHLFDNLVATPGYVSNLLNRLEAEPDIGLVIPPVIHIGFGTLGHAWFTNKTPLYKQLKAMGIEVPLDDATPVAPYGTMYWFRTAALAPMFDWPWKWEDYNPEPRHVDGGLAHIQERMIGYVVQSRNYRVLTVMTPRLAARYYARLEYKTQRIAMHLASGHVLHQVGQVESLSNRWRVVLFRRLQNRYADILTRYPKLRGPLRPLKTLAATVLSGQRPQS